jgi:hypothetical protein
MVSPGGQSQLERHKSKMVAAIEALRPGDYLDLTLA